MPAEDPCHLLDGVLLADDGLCEALLALALELEHRLEAVHVFGDAADLLGEGELQQLDLLQLLHLHHLYLFQVGLQLLYLLPLGVHVNRVVPVLELQPLQLLLAGLQRLRRLLQPLLHLHHVQLLVLAHGLPVLLLQQLVAHVGLLDLPSQRQDLLTVPANVLVVALLLVEPGVVADGPIAFLDLLVEQLQELCQGSVLD